MILYHGSNMDIREIDLSMSKVGKDFGCGFYLSADKEQAFELAERKTEQLGIGIPTLNAYDFDTSCLNNNELHVLEFQNYSKEWAEFVLMNRRNRTWEPLRHCHRTNRQRCCRVSNTPLCFRTNRHGQIP